MRSNMGADDPFLDSRTSRRGFLRGALGAATPFALAAVLGQATERAGWAAAGGGPHKLPPLPYPYGALEPHIDARTMQIHHDRHHATYVNNLNAALKDHPDLQNKSAEQLIRSLDSVPESIRTAVRNNGGGHVNHTMFWAIMRPRGGGPPRGAIAQAIDGAFGSFANFRTAFNEAGAKRFGSGWVWLVHNNAGKLQVISTPNQDNPLMEGHYPILGNDVWEHAYYLKYQNRRPDYLKAWWNTVNWDAINKRFADAQRSG